jgi:hypothetical protein
MPTDRPRFELILEDLGGEVPVSIRLRSALKRLARSFGLKCIAAVEVPSDFEPTRRTSHRPAEGK